MNDELPADDLIAGLRAGDPAAMARFVREYGPTIERFADRKLAGPLRRRVDAEDVAQSVCRTFVMRAQRGEFQLEEGGDLWRLLCAITVAKVREQARFHGRQKRGVTGEQHFDSVTPDGSPRVPEAAGRLPSPDAEAAFAEQFQQLVGGLESEEQRIVELKLAGHTNQEAADQIGCSERTVRRLMKRLQTRLESLLDG